MKARRGYRVIDANGTSWDGDCARWAEDARRMGRKVISIRIVGSKRWPCSACELGIKH